MATSHERIFIGSCLPQVYENWALGELSAGEKDEIQANYEKSLIDTLEKKQATNSLHLYGSVWWCAHSSDACSFHLADVLPTFSEGLQTLVDVRVHTVLSNTTPHP